MTELFMDELASAGLVLQGTVPLDQLESDIGQILASAGVDLSRFATLVLLGHAGSSFWDSTVRHRLDRPHPFDDSAVEIVAAWFQQRHPTANYNVVYPGEVPLPLGRLAEQAGWGRSSPVGLTIHPQFGLWIAHRVAFLTTLDVPAATRQPPHAHPCDTCLDRPCETACPAGAVSYERGFDVRACAGHRVTVASDCADQCLARNACPVGREHRYGAEQMHHHYASGLGSIRLWLESDVD